MADDRHEFEPGMLVEFWRGKPLKGWPEAARQYLRSDRTYEVAGVHDARELAQLEPFLSFTDSPVDSKGFPMQFDSRGFRPVSEGEPF